ncbi:hypothetical protein IWX91DRAFT_331151 [Phyllosticta citricarpa]
MQPQHRPVNAIPCRSTAWVPSCPLIMIWLFPLPTHALLRCPAPTPTIANRLCNAPRIAATCLLYVLGSAPNLQDPAESFMPT